MSDWIVAAETRCNGVAVELIFNGAAIVREFVFSGNMLMNKLNPWIVEGPNQLEVRVAAAAGQPSPGADAHLALAVYEGPHGTHPGPGGKLTELTWSQAAQPLAGEGFQQLKMLEFKTRAATPRWRWLDALPYSDADRPAIVARLMELHAALAASDFDAVAALTRLRDEELALALDVSLDRWVALERQSVASLFQAKNWQLQDVDASELEFHPRAGGKLVEVTRRGMQPPLVGVADGEAISFRYTFCHLAPPDSEQPGQWSVIR